MSAWGRRNTNTRKVSGGGAWGRSSSSSGGNLGYSSSSSSTRGGGRINPESTGVFLPSSSSSSRSSLGTSSSSVYTSSHAAHDENTRKNVSVVHLNGLVVMKIIKHMTDTQPKDANGRLVGMSSLVKKNGMSDDTHKLKAYADGGRDEFPLSETDRLEVTNCYPDISWDKATQTMEEYKDDLEGYPSEVMECFDLANIDTNIVGWYECSRYVAKCSKNFVTRQLHFQEKHGNKVVGIVYSPSVGCEGMSLRAFRLKPSFLAAMEKGNKRGLLTHDNLIAGKIDSNSVLEEVPIKIVHTVTNEALLMELCGGRTPVVDEARSEHLDLSFNFELEKELGSLKSKVYELCEEQEKFSKYDKDLMNQKQQQKSWEHSRYMENEERKSQGKEPLPMEDPKMPAAYEIPEPSRIQSLVAGMEIRSHCDRVDRIVASGLKKVAFTTAVHEATERLQKVTEEAK